MSSDPPRKSDDAALLSGSTSRSLIARLREDDQQAWDRLVHLYAPLVYHWCRRQGVSDQDLGDVLQEVFRSVSGSMENYRSDPELGTFRGWLRTITRHRVADHFRASGKEPQAAGGSEALWRIEQITSPEAEEDNPDDQAARQQLFRRALGLIRSDFQDKTWQAFWRTAVDGQSAQDVADELSMRPGTVRVAKSRVLQRLREELGDVID